MTVQLRRQGRERTDNMIRRPVVRGRNLLVLPSEQPESIERLLTLAGLNPFREHRVPSVERHENACARSSFLHLPLLDLRDRAEHEIHVGHDLEIDVRCGY